MKEQKTISTLFWIRKGRGNQGTAPLIVRVTVAGQRYEFNAKINVPISTWSAELQKCRGKSSLDKEVNRALDDIKIEIDDTLAKIKTKNQPITVEAFKAYFREEVNEYDTMLSLFDYHAVIEKRNISESTMKLYAVTKNHVRKFIKIKYHTSDIEISYITKSFIKEFFAYLQGYKRDPNEKVCQNNAAIKHVQRVSHLLTIAEENEWIDRNPCQYFHPKTQQKDRGHLTEEEIQAIANLHGLIGEIKVVRDLFLFAVYTGMAWVDVYNLTTDNIQTGIDGELWIEYSRKKTTHSARVPVLQPVLEIMKTYEEQMNYNAGKRIFPLPTNQEVNRYLKRIAELAHVKKNITYHIARHTFATTITLLNNVPIETVSKMLGHASIASTQIYAKVVDKKIMNDTASIRELYAQKSIEKKKASNY